MQEDVEFVTMYPHSKNLRFEISLHVSISDSAMTNPLFVGFGTSKLFLSL